METPGVLDSLSNRQEKLFVALAEPHVTSGAPNKLTPLNSDWALGEDVATSSTARLGWIQIPR